MADFLGKSVWVYIDDMLIFFDTEEDHLTHIAAICNKLKRAQFYASRKKSEFFATRICIMYTCSVNCIQERSAGFPMFSLITLLTLISLIVSQPRSYIKAG